MDSRIALSSEMKLLLSMIGGLGVMALTYLVMRSHMRRKIGIQPNYTGLIVMIVSTLGCVGAFAVLKYYGIDIVHGRPRDVFYVLLGFVWLVMAVRTGYQQRSSGEVLMDLGPAPMYRIQMFFSLLMVVIGVSFAMRPETRAQAFCHFMWAAWFFTMARGRFAVRDSGIMNGGLLPWKRITGCMVTTQDTVRLNVNKGLQRTVDLKLPAERLDGFVQLVQGHTQAHAG
jgi:hypothetical protein